MIAGNGVLYFRFCVGRGVTCRKLYCDGRLLCILDGFEVVKDGVLVGRGWNSFVEHEQITTGSLRVHFVV